MPPFSSLGIGLSFGYLNSFSCSLCRSCTSLYTSLMRNGKKALIYPKILNLEGVVFTIKYLVNSKPSLETKKPSVWRAFSSGCSQLT